MPSCGANNLGLSDGIGYRYIEGCKLNCGYYEPDIDEYYIINSTRKGVKFEMAFERRLEERDLQTLEQGQIVKLRGGFNVYDNEDEVWRSYYGYGELVEFELAVQEVLASASTL